MAKGKSRNRQHRKMKCKALSGNTTITRHLKVKGGKGYFKSATQSEKPLRANPFTEKLRNDRYARNEAD